MSIIIIIPTYGRHTLLERTLESLSKCVFPTNYVKTIVIENGPKEQAKEIVDRFNFINCEYQYLETANKSLALNKALEGLPKNTYLIFFDDDIRLATDTLLAYSNSFSLYGVNHFYGGPFNVDYEKKPSLSSQQFLPPSALGWSLKHSPVKPLDLIGFNWAVHKSKLNEVGAFDKNFGPNSTTGATGQEHDMMLRLFKAGVTPKYIEDALVWHYVPKERSSLVWALKRKYKAGVSEGIRKEVFEQDIVNKNLRKSLYELMLNIISLSRSKSLVALFRFTYYLGLYKSRELKLKHIKN